MERFSAELRAQLTGDKLEGHAAVFNVLAKLPARYEELATSAFDKVLDNDVRALVNHNPSALLGRTKSGTLKLSTDSSGLYFLIEKLPDTTHARDLRESIDRGDLDGMSFGFVPDKVSYRVAPDGRQVLTHDFLKVLLDVSPVTYPAYEGTDVALRNMTFDVPVFSAREQLIRLRAAQLLKEVK